MGEVRRALARSLHYTEPEPTGRSRIEIYRLNPVHVRNEGVTLPSHPSRYVVSYEDNDHHPMGKGGSG